MTDSIVFHPYDSGASCFMNAFPQSENRPEDAQREEAHRIITILIKQNIQAEKEERGGEDGNV